jgi:pSer/pThr/pTyr-binding forkhead associated (FHA) protein
MNMNRSRRPAADLIDAIVENMRANVESLRYTTIAPSRYTVYVSPAEYTRLEGILPRLSAETVRALNEELARQNRRGRWRNAVGQWFGQATPLFDHADARWHVEFLPDLDGELQHEQDIVVHSELVLTGEPDLGTGERTRRVTTVHSDRKTTTREQQVKTSTARAATFGRLLYEDQKGPHQFEISRESTTIGRGGTMYPVDVRLATSDDVSREHIRIRRAADTGDFFVIDLSTLGTTIDGRPVPKGHHDASGSKRENGVEAPLPPKARIGLADTVFIDFERLA